MTRKPIQPDIKEAELSADQIRYAIPILQRRHDEITSFKLGLYNNSNGDAAITDLDNKLDDSLIRIFGRNTYEYHRYKTGGLHAYNYSFDDFGSSFVGRRQAISERLVLAASNIKSAIDILQEHVEDSGETSNGRALRAYDGLELHPEISRACAKLFKDGHYANAVEAGVKALNGLVRLRSGLELDGSTLMEKAFSPNSPILPFNKLENQSDKDEQKGYMMLFAGAVSGLRNPRAHGFVQDKPERALEFIAFISLLAKLLDQTTHT